MSKQCLERKEGAKEDHIRHGKSVSRIILVHQGMPKSPWPVFICPKGSHKNMIKGLTHVITRARKGKGPKCTTHFRCPIKNYSPYWSRIMGFSVIPSRSKRPPYLKRYDINTRYEYHRGVKGHSTEDCTTFKNKVQSLIDANPTRFGELVSGHQEH